MIVYPAIDLMAGACVRLYQGDFNSVTRFAADPLETALSFADQGAEALHVVDLEGARHGRPVHAALIHQIISAVDVPVQVGGGIRTHEQLSAYLDGGARRVIVGTAAVSNPDFLERAVAVFGPDRVAAAVDVRDGEVVTDGWLVGTGKGQHRVAGALRELGVQTLLYTDTRRDGTLTSVDVQGTKRLAKAGFHVIAAGGVSTEADIRELRQAGAVGAVVGTALYRGRIDLAGARIAAGSTEGGASC